MGVKVKKALLISSTAVIMLCLLGAVNARGTVEEKDVYTGEMVYEQTHEAVFYVRALDENSSLRAAGTGFFITSDGYALTAAHVVKGASMVNVELESGGTYENVEIVFSDATADIAVLKLQETAESYPYVPFSETPPTYGSVIYAVGYPLKTTKMIVNGIVSSPETSINGNDQMLMTVPLSNGMSGGPIIDEYGCAVGIASGTLRTMTGIGVSPTTEQIQEIIKQAIVEG